MFFNASIPQAASTPDYTDTDTDTDTDRDTDTDTDIDTDTPTRQCLCVIMHYVYVMSVYYICFGPLHPPYNPKP